MEAVFSVPARKQAMEASKDRRAPVVPQTRRWSAQFANEDVSLAAAVNSEHAAVLPDCVVCCRNFVLNHISHNVSAFRRLLMFAAFQATFVQGQASLEALTF